jgi:uncharacterized protein
LNDAAFEIWLSTLAAWTAGRGDLIGVAIVGSHGRGAARPDSDVDVVLVAEDAATYLEDSVWLSDFGRFGAIEREDYGLVQSLRVHYEGGYEVEWCITDRRWCALPSDPGTAAVVRAGMRIVFDREGKLRDLEVANFGGG